MPLQDWEVTITVTRTFKVKSRKNTTALQIGKKLFKACKNLTITEARARLIDNPQKLD